MPDITEQLDLERTKLVIKVCGQFSLFVILFVTGWLYGSSYLSYYRIEYASYSFSTYSRLAELKSSLVDGCSNLTDLPCSFQMDIDVYFFWTKFLLVYYSSIIITMIYTLHETVRFLSCVYTFSIVADIIFRTDLILYFDKILNVSPFVGLMLIVVLTFLRAYITRDDEDPLSVFCGYNIPSDDLYEFLQNDPSKRARFYRWAKKMKQQWNIEEEKFIITIIVGVFTSIIIIILDCYIIPTVLHK